MNLDFSKCKTPEDVKKVYEANKDSVDAWKEARKKLGLLLS